MEHSHSHCNSIQHSCSCLALFLLIILSAAISQFFQPQPFANLWRSHLKFSCQTLTFITDIPSPSIDASSQTHSFLHIYSHLLTCQVHVSCSHLLLQQVLPGHLLQLQVALHSINWLLYTSHVTSEFSHSFQINWSFPQLWWTSNFDQKPSAQFFLHTSVFSIHTAILRCNSDLDLRHPVHRYIAPISIRCEFHFGRFYIWFLFLFDIFDICCKF